MNGKLLNESHSNKDVHFDAEGSQTFHKSPQMFGKIWKVPDTEDGRPKFQMSCPKCESVCSDLVGHIKSKHIGMDWRGIKTPCPYEDCEKVIVDAQNHIKRFHLKIKNYSCDLCDAKFPSRSQVRKHMNGVHSNFRKKCPHCDVLLKTTTMKIHITNVHEGGRKRAACTESDCTKTFVTKSDMQHHVNYVHKKIKVPCPDCGKSLRKDALTYHIKTQHKKLYHFTCKQCKKDLKSLKTLKIHIRTKHGLTEDIKTEDDKKVIYLEHVTNKDKRQDHVSPEHVKNEEEKIVKCPEYIKIEDDIKFIDGNINFIGPDIKFIGPDINLISSDMNFIGPDINFSVPDINFISPDDDKKVIFPEHVKIEDEKKVIGHEQVQTEDETNIIGPEHVKIEDEKKVIDPLNVKIEDIKKLPCTEPECTYQAKTRYFLKQHIKGAHDGKRTRAKCGSYFCQECGKGFAKKYQLRNHINKIHLKLRSKCPDCGVEVAATHLKIHMRSHVKTEKEKKPNICQQCEKAFRDPGTMKKHTERTHLGITEKCPRCGLETKDLYRHMKYTNCESEMYTPRRKKPRKKDKRIHFSNE